MCIWTYALNDNHQRLLVGDRQGLDGFDKRRVVLAMHRNRENQLGELDRFQPIIVTSNRIDIRLQGFTGRRFVHHFFIVLREQLVRLLQVIGAQNPVLRLFLQRPRSNIFEPMRVAVIKLR